MPARKVASARRPQESRFEWDERSGRYRGPGGRFVAPDAVKRSLEITIREGMDRSRAIALQLQKGEITLAEWTLAMKQEIKRAHLWQAAAARGGWGQMTATDYGRVGNIVRRQYEYLHRFAREIETGRQRLDGFFFSRAGMYIEASRSTFEHVNMVEQGGRFDQVRNRLGRAEHCDDCIRETKRGWVALDAMSLPGTRKCRSRCKCRLEYRSRPVARRRRAT